MIEILVMAEEHALTPMGMDTSANVLKGTKEEIVKKVNNEP